MNQQKLNCWEYMDCRREPGGLRAAELGICPAAADASFDGINSGVCGGRICWAVAGTFCEGKVQGSFAEKRTSCLGCDFYQKVRSEEGNANLDTKFLRFISKNGTRTIFNKMTYRHIKAGERFVTQDQVEETAYIIQRGSCLAIVEKDGELYPVGHYGEGDIVGGLGILTGEPRRAHVEAETDMELWVLKKRDFDDISSEDTEILTFITELVADRLDSRRPTAYRTIGKYVTTDIIGRGAFSIVYKGMHKGLSMPVAIKMMRHDMAMNREFLESFLREAKMIAGLNHENIIRIFDFEERYRTVFIIEELVEGLSLKSLIERLKAISPPSAVHYLMQICSGLSYAHQRGIVHRDINTTNIFVQRDDRIKILDFGLACPIGTEDFSSCGTAEYMAPEQIRGDPMDPRVDIYAMGITAFEMVTGKKPFAEENLSCLFETHLNQDIPDPRKIQSHIPEGLSRFIQKASQRAPKQRYQTADEALSSLYSLSKEPGFALKSRLREISKMSTIILIYDEKKRMALNRLMEEFGGRAKMLGVEVKISEVREF